ncbi:MAG TPA: hypothetical protein VFD63_23650 [Pyrinomonadaceae bacterium]|nr:hypothetical protein [Pyrinomonadaceae bacterium]
MKYSRLGALLVTLILVCGGLLIQIGRAAKNNLPAQAGKSLYLETFSNQPLQLVDIRIGENSVKDKIVKHSTTGDEGLDVVEFRESADWHKRVWLKLRNSSGKAITSFKAYLYFRNTDMRTVLFSMPLERYRKIKGGPLRSGEEIELRINQAAHRFTSGIAKHYGADLDASSVTFSVQNVMFSDDLQWNKGRLLRPDPLDSNRWNVIDGVASNSAIDSLKFIKASFKTKAPTFQTTFDHCVNYGGYQAFHCSAYGCYQFFEAGYGFGSKSKVAEVALCRELNPLIDSTAINCMEQTTHYVLETDPTCSGASPTPTPSPEPSPEECSPGICEDPTATHLNYCAWPETGCPPGQQAGGYCCYPACTPTPPPTCFGLLLSPRPPWCVWGCIPREEDEAACESEGWYWNANFFTCSPSGTQAGCTSAGWWWNSFYGNCQNCSNAQCPLNYTKDDECNCTVYTGDGSPIVVDPVGNGIKLTNAVNGVSFDLNSDGKPERLSWIATGSDDGWLVLDRNGNGTVDNGKELFGNFTPQPDPPPGEERNGFLALAEYDKLANGGNADGFITAADTVFSTLRLWQDTNHNGISEASELKSLLALKLSKIECQYKESERTDGFGNRFRYRAKVEDSQGSNLGRWAWDVFLVLAP